MTQALRKAYIELHIAVALFGLTAILGAKIALPALVLIWWRMLITAISFLVLTKVGASLRGLPRKTILQFLGIGVLTMLHWLCFYGAIKLANASIALACYATTSLFSSLLEPLLMNKRIQWYEVVLSALILPGVYLIKDQTKLEMLPGFWVGLLGALLASVFTIMNKRLIAKADPMTITFLEIGGGWLSMNLFFPIYLYLHPEVHFLPSGEDWIYLLVLSLLCTTLGYTLAIRSLRHLSAFATNLALNLEPVYGIVLAWLVLNENKDLSANFYWGGAIIIMAVMSYPYLKRRMFKVGGE